MLARKSLLTILTNAVGAALGLAGVLAIGRFMGPGPLGALAYTLGLVGIAVFVSRLGYDTAHTKRISEGVDLSRSIGTYLVIKLVLTLVFVALAVLAIVLWDTLHGFYDTALPVLFLILAYYLAMALRAIPEYTFTGLRLVASLQAMVLVEHIAKFPLVIAVALLYGFQNEGWVPMQDLVARLADLLGIAGPIAPLTGAAWLAVAWAFAMFVSFLFGIVHMRRHGLRAGRFDRQLARSYTEFALPIALVSAMNIIALQLDAVMIGFFWSDEDVGFYYTAQRITSVLLIIPLALKGVYFPTVSGMAAAGEHEAVRALSMQTQRYMSLVVVLATMFLVLYAADGIHVFVSDEFLPAAPVLQLMAVATLLVALVQVANGLLMGYDDPRWVARVGVVATLVNVTLNTVFIPDSFLGIPMLGLRAAGAALATLVSFAVLLGFSLYVVRRRTGWTPFYGGSWKHAVAAALTALVLHLLDATPLLDRVDRWWEIGIAAGLGTLLYVAFLVGLRELGRRDVALFLDMLHPGRMGEYVRGELSGRRR